MIEYSTRVVTPEQAAALADYRAARTYAELDVAAKRMRELGMLSAGEGLIVPRRVLDYEESTRSLGTDSRSIVEHLAATVDKLIAASESEPKAVVLFVSEGES